MNKTTGPTGLDAPIDINSAKDRAMGDMDFLKEMLGEFHSSIPSYLETVKRAVKNHDAMLLSKTAHQLKGAALSLSVNRIAAHANMLNELGRTENFENAETAIRDLESAVLDFEDYLQKSNL